ncbi:MAG: hypothetical protein HQK50_11780 [Oligoflexia bacterium]|nr:hypothetical protein [Oligoflexia bacterium]MBF0366243.1 hypothetical protein [Oligoflexia bacterium]
MTFIASSLGNICEILFAKTKGSYHRSNSSSKEHSLETFLNALLESPKWQALENSFGHHFKNHHLLLQALTHRSFINDGRGKIFSTLIDNERLEYLGDTLFNTLISIELFKRFPLLREGELSKLRSAIVNTQTLAVFAKSLCLDHLVLMGRGEIKKGGHFNERVLAQLFEAFVAAVYFDLEGDFNLCAKKMVSFLDRLEQEKIITIFDERLLEDYDVISRLQEQMMVYKCLPEYKVVAELPPFTVSLHLFGKEVAVVTENSKKKAYRKLAKYALENKLYNRI